jgi:hypothetical protein
MLFPNFENLEIVKHDFLLTYKYHDHKIGVLVKMKLTFSRLKRHVIGLVALERSRKRQASRITSLKEGDANTRFFISMLMDIYGRTTFTASSTIMDGLRTMIIKIYQP